MVVPVAAPSANAVVEALRREPLDVELVTADVLRGQPAARVYVFAFTGALAVALADRIVTWAREIEVSPGLIGIVGDGSTTEREALLAAGFDDVVTGSLGARELSARARAVHRRMFARGRDGRLRYGPMTLDLDNHALWVDGRTLSLTMIELAVMRELIKAAGKPLSRAQLLDVAWGAGELDVSERAVDNVILRLRRKLPRPELIETVRSIGFRIAA